MAFFSTRTGQFTYFSLQVGDPLWKGKKILDFGGNVGNILRDPNSNIEEDHYWCLDIVKDSLEKGKTSYPRAHWIFYNRYCFSFNPDGVPGLPIPDMRQSFDYIVAFSVFTNTTQSDMLQLVPQLEAMLSTNGALAFTFIDPQYCSSPACADGNNFQWRVRLEIERGNVSALEGRDIVKRAQHANWFMLVNGSDLYIETEDIRPYEPDRQKTCYVFHTERYMKTLFPNAMILPPVNNEMQHCCLIRKS
jgi:methyltransferase family protein